MSETIGIRYYIPQVTFNKKPSGNQTFALFYRRGDNPSRSWIKKTDSYVVDRNGKNTNNVYLDGLIEDADYQFSLAVFPYEDEQTAAKAGAIFSFHTCVNMTAGDSPYVNKLLMPGQTFDWYYSGTQAISMPTSSQTAWYYQATRNKTNEGENYYSLEIGGATNWKQGISADNELEAYSGFYCNEGSYIKLPNTYVKNPGGFITGRIYAADIHGFLTVSFFLEEGYTNAAIVTIEALYNNVGSEGQPIYHQVSRAEMNDQTAIVSYSIFVEDGKLNYRKYSKKSAADGGEVTINEEAVLSNTLSGGVESLSTNKWYTFTGFEALGSISIYEALKPEELSGNTYYREVYKCAGPGQPPEATISNAGDPAQDGLGVGFGYNPEVMELETSGLIVNHIGQMTTFSQLDFNKIAASYMYIPRLGFYNVGAATTMVNCKYIQPVSYTNIFSDDTLDEMGQIATRGKVSYLIDPSIGGTDNPKLSSGSYKIAIQSYAQFISNSNSTTMEPIVVVTQKEQVINEGYIVDFEEDFDNALTLFRNKFYTKHGTWGGYNGGCNSNLVYASKAEKCIVLEAHGDNYPTNGQVFGVGKESWVTEAGKAYTGYGENINYYAKNDTRTTSNIPFKQRVGAVLRTVDYFAYGKYTVRMAIPELKAGTTNWGLCPALWFFHYQEFGEGSTGYNKWMASSNPVGRIYNREGDEENGYYCVVNNEIDLELPSNDTQDFFPTAAIGGTRYTPWDFVKCAYFDRNIIYPNETVPAATNPPYRIGIVDDNSLPYEDVGRFKLTGSDPNDRASWEHEREVFVATNSPNFCNCKFNNWQGEYTSGNGWESRQDYLPAKVNGAMPAEGVTAARLGNENYYKNDITYKEEYIAFKTPLTDERLAPKGFADGRFHDWTICWYPNHTELWVDGIKIQESWGFVPFNCMHFVIGIWFPTIPVKKIDGEWTVLGYDKSTPVTDAATMESTGTWAGPDADFEAWHLKISKMQYQPLTTDEMNANLTNRPTTELLYDGESFPESGMRYII